MLRELGLFTGNANIPLANRVCKELGIDLGKAEVKSFSDGEIQVEIKENIRGRRVYIIQSTCAGSSASVNDKLMELLILIDAMRRASAQEIVAVIPYYGYARQDRKVAPRAPITSKLVANLITIAGATRVITMDLHAGQIQGFFDIPVDNLYFTPVIYPAIKEILNQDDFIVVAPDAGGVGRARALAKVRETEIAIIDKRREGPNRSDVFNIIGNVKDKTAIIVDDIVDTAGTLTKSAKALIERGGAKKVLAICTHPVLSGDAVKNIGESVIETLFVSDSIPLRPEAELCRKIKVITIATFLANVIQDTFYHDSISKHYAITP